MERRKADASYVPSSSELPMPLIFSHTTLPALPWILGSFLRHLKALSNSYLRHCMVKQKNNCSRLPAHTRQNIHEDHITFQPLHHINLSTYIPYHAKKNPSPPASIHTECVSHHSTITMRTINQRLSTADLESYRSPASIKDTRCIWALLHSTVRQCSGRRLSHACRTFRLLAA
jgi:hypothetical protein